MTPEEHAPDLIRGENRFSDTIMRKHNQRHDRD
jgi:hypothetical protein